LVQRGGKQILVPSKNIIKLSPNAGATSSLTNTAAEQTASPTSGLHAIQLPGKGGVQYVRVLTNNKSASGTSATVAMPKTMQAHKITAVRSPAATSTPATSTSTSAAAAPATAAPKANTSMGSTNKIVMRTTGGSIVPLPSMQTLVSKVGIVVLMPFSDSLNSIVLFAASNGYQHGRQRQRLQVSQYGQQYQ